MITSALFSHIQVSFSWNGNSSDCEEGCCVIYQPGRLIDNGSVFVSIFKLSALALSFHLGSD